MMSKGNRAMSTPHIHGGHPLSHQTFCTISLMGQLGTHKPFKFPSTYFQGGFNAHNGLMF